MSAIKARAEAANRQAATPAAASPTAASPTANAGQWVVDVTEATFQAEVVDRSLHVPVVVDLWASWCGPCKQLSPVLERLAGAGGGAWVLAKVDVDANPRIAQLFGVQSIPTVVAIAGGQPVDAFAGALPEPEIKQWLTALLDAMRDRLPGIQLAEHHAGVEAGVEEQPPEDPRFVAAESALDAGDFGAAEAAYQSILDAEPSNEQAKAALSQVRFLGRVSTADPSSIARADADPDDYDAQMAAADAELAAQRADDAFRRLVNAIRRTSGDDRDRLRKHLVDLFELFPPDDPRIAKARRDLASALY